MIGELIKRDNLLDRDYVFMSFKEFAKFITDMFCKEPSPTPVIDFAFNDKESVMRDGEATGWYGATLMEMFDGNYIVMGYYGGLNLQTIPLDEIDDYEYSDVIEALAHLAACEPDANGSSIAIDASTIPVEFFQNED